MRSSSDVPTGRIQKSTTKAMKAPSLEFQDGHMRQHGDTTNRAPITANGKLEASNVDTDLSSKRWLSPKAIPPCCVGVFQSCIRQDAASYVAPQAEETRGNLKYVELGTELPLTAQHPMQVSQCHLSLETATSQGLPQRAFLSCLLFNIMIVDLETAIQKVPEVYRLFFAYNVVIWATGSNIRSLEDALNISLLYLPTWATPTKGKSVLRR
ncbi:hypothetical protein TNIN_191371 [Trichonephila inaurata madagascariensis]|uniref:Uncharacterized protein n=1 Tax=Trichonephila inaurata madagascariensis TaxID=2747483 RepID=A0A8X6I5S6_9ARAC|nr:hypothetical protein TNIN_191371 [Trichonephila inaurata madagascariensis]